MDGGGSWDGPTEPGSVMTITLPPGAVFVDVYPSGNGGDPNNDPTVAIAHALTPWWTSTGGQIEVTFSSALGWTTNIAVELWLPCDAIPVTASDPNLQTSVVWDGFEQTATGLVPRHMDAIAIKGYPPADAGGDACGDPATSALNKYAYGSWPYGPGTGLLWYLNARGVKG